MWWLTDVTVYVWPGVVVGVASFSLPISVLCSSGFSQKGQREVFVGVNSCADDRNLPCFVFQRSTTIASLVLKKALNFCSVFLCINLMAI